MRTTLSLMMVVILASACAPQRPSSTKPITPEFDLFAGVLGEPVPNQKQIAAKNLAYAGAQFDNSAKERCIESYKSKMHDPSSFQLAGTFTAHEAPLNRWGTGVMFIAPMRGKNAMGGLVLKSLACEYHVDSTIPKIHFIGAKSF